MLHQGTGHPQLGVGQMHQPPPGFLTAHLRRLKAGQEELLPGKAEEVLQVGTMQVIGLVNVQQFNLLSPLADDDEPKRSLVDRSAVGVYPADTHQGQGMLMHRQAPGLLFTTHEQVMPGLDVHLVLTTATTAVGGRACLVRRVPAGGVFEGETVAVLTRTTAAGLLPGRRLSVKGAVAAHAGDGHQIFVMAVGL